MKCLMLGVSYQQCCVRLREALCFSQLYNLFLAVICSLSFNQDFTKEDFEYLVENWETKLDRCGRGDQKWGLFHARK